MYETNQHHNQELMTDWTSSIAGLSGGSRREKEKYVVWLGDIRERPTDINSIMNDSRTLPSPTYSHTSPVDSNNPHSSPYDMPQTVIGPNQSGAYQVAYPTISGPHLLAMPLQVSQYNQLPHPPSYYHMSTGDGEYDLYQEPGPAASKVKHSTAPFSDAQSFHYDLHHQHGATPLMTTATLARAYNSTIPQYYPISSEPRWNDLPTPDKVKDEEKGPKRKRGRHAKDTSPTTIRGMKTPKRRPKQTQEEVSGRAAKRIKVEEPRHQQAQLPTPPSTGRETCYINLSQQFEEQTVKDKRTRSEGTPEDESAARRRGVVVTRHNEEGRKIGLPGLAQGEAEATVLLDEAHISPRTTFIPALSINASGLASLSTDEILESEMAWLENGGCTHSPPSSPDLVRLQTPTMTHDAVILEDGDSTLTKEERSERRLQAFTDASKLAEPLVCTRIDLFGRVAVRKGMAIKFLGLDGTARIVEETREDDSDGWIERRPMASCSRPMVKPTWPDNESPWALAGGTRRERTQREESEKAEILRRYFDSGSDESSDDENYSPILAGRGKGKTVLRLIRSSLSDTSDTPGTWTHNVDAKEALFKSIRGRALPPILPGKIACACGAQTAAGMGSMVSCSSCKTWHHLVCCGIEEESQLGPHWWCSRCQAEAVAMSTPAHMTSYAQSDERSSAFKGELKTIALAPSPMFMNGATFSQNAASARTPMNRAVNSPSSRNHRSRILSYGTDMWAYTEDGPPSTPIPSGPERHTTPRLDEVPFDVTSTPSRHLDFNFSQPSLFSLTPLGGRSRIPSTMLMDGTPFRARNSSVAEGIAPRHEFFRELNKGTEPASPQPRWPHALLGAHNVSPSPFGHRRTLSGNKMSNLKPSSRSGLGIGMAVGKDQ